MTTFQDPPLSRRASRQGERQDAQPTSSSTFVPPQIPRSAAGVGEPLSYVTQNRPPLPGYDAPPQRGRRASEPVPLTSSEGQAAQFRPRDFSPEARTAPPAWTPEQDRENGVLDHHTQVRSSVVPPGGSLAASLAADPSEQTLSRRELRAIRDAQEAPVAPAPPEAPQQPVAYEQPMAQPSAYQAPPAPQPIAPQQPSAPQQFAAPPAPAPSSNLDSAMAEFDELAARSSATVPPAAPSRRAGRRVAPVADVAPEDGLGAFDALFGTPAAVPQSAPEPQQPVSQPAAPIAPVAQPVVPPQQVVPVAPVSEAPALEAVAPTAPERPVGHWTNQADLDDAEQIETTVSRIVGSATITTSALVLPSIPGHDMSTGEVLLTDSISLPSALASTGAHTPLDDSDIDHLLDPGDHQLVNTDSVPIRAIRAVSSHTSTRGVIGAPPPKKTGRALTALIVAASVMVVVVVVLLVVALATDVI